MDSHFTAYLISAGAVTLAEMADKTQLMTMAFAAKYKVSKVIIGVLLAIILNQGLAVALGSIIGQNQQMNVWIQMVASASFISFGLWGIRGEKSETIETRKSRYGVVLTVAIAFFIAELGDKTQLSTIAFAVKYPGSAIAVLLGSITGMIIANTLGIIIGVLLCKHIPEDKIKFISALAFILFGFIGLYQVMYSMLHLDISIIAVILLLAAIVTGSILYYIIINRVVIKEPKSGKYCKEKLR